MVKNEISEIDWRDELQLCAQAMCLEEMLSCQVDEGLITESRGKRTVTVAFTEEKRKIVKAAFLEMHKMYRQKHVPKVKIKNRCEECPLKDVCLPELMDLPTVKQYLQQALEEL